MYRGPSTGSLAGSGSSTDTLAAGVSMSTSSPDFPSGGGGGGGSSGRPARRVDLVVSFCHRPACMPEPCSMCPQQAGDTLQRWMLDVEGTCSASSVPQEALACIDTGHTMSTERCLSGVLCAAGGGRRRRRTGGTCPLRSCP